MHNTDHGNDKPTNSRLIQYIRDVDNKGHTAGEIIKVKNWGAVVKPKYAQSLSGSCSVAINLYPTRCHMLINGADASKFIDVFAPVLEQSIFQNKAKLDEANFVIGTAIKATSEARKTPNATENNGNPYIRCIGTIPSDARGDKTPVDTHIYKAITS